MTIRAVLFDKDGTLIDFADTFFEACSKIILHLANNNLHLATNLANAVGFDLQTFDCTASSEIVGGTSMTIARIWQPILDRSTVSQLSLELDGYFDKYTELAVTAFEFTRPTLEKLDDMDLALGVATNDSENNARHHLGTIKVEELFSFVAGYDSGYGPKPEPGMIRAFASQQQIAPDEVVMVGDSINDLLAGKNASALAVAVTSGLAGNDELRPFADHVIADISQLPELLIDLA
ncbi:MAG: HAD family hydrolase [Hyphomicrobiales bacterium]|nr:HAD family hydrolase [Hyphomicrobiales bacterium]